MSAASKEKPAVSVVIAAYNAEAYLAETLESVQAQTYRDFEIVVVDDGSTDATAEIARAHEKVRCLHQENQGQPAARNAGIRAARGRYVAFVDADDLWRPEKLARQMQLLEDPPERAWCYTDALLFDSDTGAVTGASSQGQALREGDVLRPLLLGSFIPSPTPVVRRDVFESVGLFDEDPAVRNGEDWAMWLRIAAQYSVSVVPEPLALIRQHAESMTHSDALDYALNSRLKIVQDALRRHPEVPAGLRRRAVSNVYVAIGRWALRRGDRPAARRLMGEAVRRAPLHGAAWAYALAAWLPPPVRRLLGAVRRAVRNAGGAGS